MYLFYMTALDERQEVKNSGNTIEVKSSEVKKSLFFLLRRRHYRRLGKH